MRTGNTARGAVWVGLGNAEIDMRKEEGKRGEGERKKGESVRERGRKGEERRRKGGKREE